jgi:large subunit ribosomal protein L29
MKNKDITALTDQEIADRLKEEKEALGKMKINHNVSPVENPMTIRSSRKLIARLSTEATKRKKASK